MIVRRAIPDDADAIADISVRAWREAYRHILPADRLLALDTGARAARWRERVSATPPEDVWVVETDCVIGFAAGCPKWDEPFLDEWFITAVYVDPDRQGKGAGRLLLREAIGYGLNQNQPDVKLSVFTENQRARTFYARCGGEEILDGTWAWEGETYPTVYVRFNQTP